MHQARVWVTASALAVLLEIVAGRHNGVYRRGEIAFLAASLGIGRILLSPVAALLVAWTWSALFPAHKGALAGTPFWIALPLVLLVNEFFFYWIHRWSHTGWKERSLLSMMDRTHHTATYMNVAVSMRLNAWWCLIIPSAWTMGLFIYFGIYEAVGAAVVLIAVWNIVTHCDFRWDDVVRRHPRFGPAFRVLEHVIVSSGIHHTHHGYGRDGASYRNFGVMLSVWDWVFGTLHIPDGRPWRYGIPGHNAHLLKELLWPLVRIDMNKNRRQAAA